MSIRTWALAKAKAHMAGRPPDFEIGPPEDRYLQRWIVGPWGRGDPFKMGRAQRFFRMILPNLYLHRIRHDDEDRALHDHPFDSISWLLENGYDEVRFYPITEERENLLREQGVPRPTYVATRPEGSVTARRAEAAHRLVLWTRPGRLGRTEPIEVVSAFFVGPRRREWYFHCPKGLVFWRNFVDSRDRRAVGRGCGD